MELLATRALRFNKACTTYKIPLIIGSALISVRLHYNSNANKKASYLEYCCCDDKRSYHGNINTVKPIRFTFVHPL